jgi:hypothetical protein
MSQRAFFDTVAKRKILASDANQTPVIQPVATYLLSFSAPKFDTRIFVYPMPATCLTHYHTFHLIIVTTFVISLLSM